MFMKLFGNVCQKYLYFVICCKRVIIIGKNIEYSIENCILQKIGSCIKKD